ncbi:hypothetical protein [Chryseobacterium sp. BIGb0232]|nr:hypothetical protein [Chryseobacterium sp. BIGb0232]MCS4302733.1 hypothetical protein [Chryseobacterium sp. BIGb0232]
MSTISNALPLADESENKFESSIDDIRNVPETPLDWLLTTLYSCFYE